MNKHHLLLLALIVSACVCACKKDKKTATTPVSPIDSTPVVIYDNYTMLTPGNYWIYQDYTIDPAYDTATPIGTYDSVFVAKDTIINGHTFHTYCDVPPIPGTSVTYDISYLRDSLSYIIDNNGNIQFSSADFNNIFSIRTILPNAASPDTAWVTRQMGFKDSLITVDAGTFTTSTLREIFIYSGNPPFGKIREYDHMYCKNVGLICYTTNIYTSSPVVHQRRLERYHVQ